MSRPYDEECMRAAIALSAKAVEEGCMPFGAILVDENGVVLVEEHNRSSATGIRGGGSDVTRHAEVECVRTACLQGISPEVRKTCTMYASTEPCVMCAGAIFWAGIGRIVFGCEAEQLQKISGPGGFDYPVAKLYELGGPHVSTKIQVEGPFLDQEALGVHRQSGVWTKSQADADVAVERALFASGLGAAATGQSVVPVIDMSIDDQDKLAEQLWEAASTVGFFSVVGHGISEDLIDGAFEASKNFFALPQDQKELLSPFAAQLNAGYEYMTQVRPSTGTADCKESIQITARRGCMEGRWPSEEFEDTSKTLAENCHTLASRLLNLLQPRACPHLKEGTLANSHTLWEDDGQCTLRMLHYPSMDEETLEKLVTPDSDGRISWRAGPHTDWSNLTLLFQRPGQEGLECCSNPRLDGPKTWTPVPPVKGGIAINIGDMLARWSDGRLYSNLHRVRMPTKEECVTSRYSIAFFLQADKSALMESREVEPITAGDYILGRIQSNFAK